MARYGSWVVEAVLGHEVIGYAWIVRAVGDDGGCYAEEAAVRDGFRERGVGSGLVREAARWMAEQRFRWIGATSLHDAHQERREAWLSRLGFARTSSGMFRAPPEVIAIFDRSTVVGDEWRESQPLKRDGTYALVRDGKWTRLWLGSTKVGPLGSRAGCNEFGEDL
jgi:hypothetical protein